MSRCSSLEPNKSATDRSTFANKSEEDTEDSKPNVPKPIRLSVQYDKKLQEVTGKEKHPPGMFRFSINDIAPKIHTPLFGGDIVFFTVSNL